MLGMPNIWSLIPNCIQVTSYTRENMVLVQTFSERRSQFRERNVSGAHFINHERKKSGAHLN